MQLSHGFLNKFWPVKLLIILVSLNFAQAEDMEFTHQTDLNQIEQGRFRSTVLGHIPLEDGVSLYSQMEIVTAAQAHSSLNPYCRVSMVRFSDVRDIEENEYPLHITVNRFSESNIFFEAQSPGLEINFLIGEIQPDSAYFSRPLFQVQCYFLVTNSLSLFDDFSVSLNEINNIFPTDLIRFDLLPPETVEDVRSDIQQIMSGIQEDIQALYNEENIVELQVLRERLNTLRGR